MIQIESSALSSTSGALKDSLIANPQKVVNLRLYIFVVKSEPVIHYLHGCI